MRRRRNEDFNFWPAVADVFLSGFVILLVLWFLNSVFFSTKVQPGMGAGGRVLSPEEAREYEDIMSNQKDTKELLAKIKEQEEQLTKQAAELVALRRELTVAQRASADLRVRLKAAEDRVAELQAKLDEANKRAGQFEEEKNRAQAALHDKPAVIPLKETDGYVFPLGKDSLDWRFMKNLRENVYPSLNNTLSKYGNIIKGIEIIGHTDGTHVGGRESNLDQLLVARLKGGAGAPLQAGSNSDLGMMRAAAVRGELRSWLDKNGYEKIPIYCYSAGQTQLPGGGVPMDDQAPVEDEQRRRIEIRFTGLDGSR